MKALIKPEISKGKLLISQPLINDDFFHNSVIFITEYNASGVVGFIINKPVPINLSDLIVDFPDFNTSIFYGGPVASDNLYFLHRVPHKINGSIHIANDLYWGGDFNQVKELIKLGTLNPEDIRFFLGYSGWDIEQLDNEIKEDSWFVDDIEQSIFDWDVAKLWKNRLELKDEKYKIWANAPNDIRLN